MYNGQVISLKQILWSIMRMPLYSDLQYEDAAEYATEAIKLIGSPLIFDTITTKAIPVVAYKAALPANLIKINGVRVIYDLDNYENGAQALREASDIYHASDNCGTNTNDCGVELTYTAGNGVIKTAFETGYIQISYDGLVTDKEGYPMIPDVQEVKFAIEYFIRYRYMEPLWEMGKITDKVWQNIDQKKSWYMGAASTSTKLSGMDHAETVANSINRLILNNNMHKNFYKGLGIKEIIKRYN